MWSRLSPKIRGIATAIVAAAAVLIVVQIMEIVWYGLQDYKLKEASVSFSSEKGVLGKVLIVGDSTGVGVGATRPEESIAGLLNKDGYAVKNLAEWGALTKETLVQIKKEEGNKYDLVFVFTGGNDIIWMRDLKKTALYFQDVLDEAKNIGRKVVVMPPGNVGLAPVFKEPIGLLYASRTAFIREFFIREARESGAVYVDLFTNSLEELFEGDSERYFAADFFHPNSEGYRIWYQKLKEQVEI